MPELFSSLEALPQLLSVAASSTAALIDVADLAAPFQLTRQAIHDYVTVLECLFLLETFVFQELRRQASWRPLPPSFFHRARSTR